MEYVMLIAANVASNGDEEQPEGFFLFDAQICFISNCVCTSEPPSALRDSCYGRHSASAASQRHRLKRRRRWQAWSGASVRSQS